ncbi:molybdopterin molybdenumtransferase MoeA [Polymorphobacter arshaanensis]|uniref:Molybdopterin molybdenumtransferase n=1 Tax=Glacieibacterium arshaanense TaxID=2511025 RepID=A0A4Y9ERF4_9SPHN|nr:gephyrin-like molybdotransferase Glp [Polymorphobacter arshaanensis]TFU06227.1 molybdopterin molybdenumtransferase MoeA [Polymorphobacter arshaanensis]
MISVEAAQANLLDGVVPLAAESVALAAAAGRILAEPLAALRTQPPFAASAMDGYSIRWTDRAGPWRIIGTAFAGAGFDGSVGAGEAARILTGAPVPTGADTVIVQEDVARDGDNLRLTGEGPPRQGAHIRRAGLDFSGGEALLAPGTRLLAPHIGLIAAAGHAAVRVHRRPRVALLATGDELVLPGAVTGPDQIVSSNGVMLAALLGDCADVHDAGIVRDSPGALRAAVEACADADVLVTIGGASVGDHDLVKPVLESMGARFDFWKVAMRPGKPVMRGWLGSQNVIGLPGNPVSAFVTALLFVKPLLQRLGGAAVALPMLHQARLNGTLPANGSRQDYMRAVAVRDSGGWRITTLPTQDSSMLRTLASANALLVREIDAPAVGDGGPVSFLLLDSLRDVA